MRLHHARPGAGTLGNSMARAVSLFATLVVTLAAVVIGSGVSAPAFAGRPSQVFNTGVSTVAPTNFYRLFNPLRGDHFHTTSLDEVSSAVSSGTYRYEGVGALVSSTVDTGLVPFYRLFNPGRFDHFHTTNWNEVISAVSSGTYRYEGIAGYVYPANSTSGVPFYRLFNPSSFDHFHTTNWNEVISAVASGTYRYEGIGARVLG
jgi:hypothetical protein